MITLDFYEIMILSIKKVNTWIKYNINFPAAYHEHLR